MKLGDVLMAEDGSERRVVGVPATVDNVKVGSVLLYPGGRCRLEQRNRHDDGWYVRQHNGKQTQVLDYYIGEYTLLNPEGPPVPDSVVMDRERLAGDLRATRDAIRAEPTGDPPGFDSLTDDDDLLGGPA